MKVSLTKGLTPERAAEVEGNFKAAALLRERLAVLLEEKAASSRSSVRSKETYENPNWAYLQADARGYERALLEVASLLK